MNSEAPCCLQRTQGSLGLGHYLWPCWCPRCVQSPKSCCFKWPVLPPRAVVKPRSELLPRAMSESVFLLPVGSMLMSVACVTILGHKKHAVMKSEAMVSWPVLHWPCHSVYTATRELAQTPMGKLPPFNPKGSDDLTSQHSKELSLVVQGNPSAATQNHIQGLVLAHPKIYPI